MSSVREFHNQAMQYAQNAVAAAQQKDEDQKILLIDHAMQYEIRAAELLPEEQSSEPTRSILYRSAASFAYQAGNYQEAERLIFKGLSGYPTPISKAQLLDVQTLIQAAIASEIIGSLPLSEHKTVTIQIYPELAVAT